MADSRTPLQRIGAILLLGVACGYAVTAGYWMNENSFELTVINFFWCAVFGSAALILDGPHGVRQRLLSLGWLRLLGSFFVFIALCDLAVAGYWFAQRKQFWVLVNLIGMMFFGGLGGLCFMLASRQDSKDRD